MKVNEEMYYLNTPCVVKALLENNEVVIETLVGELDVELEYDEYQGDSYIEPVQKTIIVNTKYITKEIVDFEGESIKVLKDAEVIANKTIFDAEKKARGLVEDATLEAEAFNKEANEELKLLLNKISQVKGFEPYIDYMKGDTKYVVRDAYSWGKEWNKHMYTYDKFQQYRIDGDEEGNLIPLKAFALEQTKLQKKEISMKITGDYYGGTTNYTVHMFKTKEEMENYVVKSLDYCNDIRDEGLNNLKKWNIAHDLITKVEKEKEDKKAEYKADKRAKLEKELLDLDNE
jgi:hypothetical protein